MNDFFFTRVCSWSSATWLYVVCKHLHQTLVTSTSSIVWNDWISVRSKHLESSLHFVRLFRGGVVKESGQEGQHGQPGRREQCHINSVSNFHIQVCHQFFLPTKKRTTQAVKNHSPRQWRRRSHFGHGYIKLPQQFTNHQHIATIAEFRWYKHRLRIYKWEGEVVFSKRSKEAAQRGQTLNGFQT